MKHASHILHMFTLSLLLLVCALALPVAAQDQLVTLVGDGSVMLRSPSGETLVSLNPDIPLVPASILKIPLAQVALTRLGEDFRFETHFYRMRLGLGRAEDIATLQQLTRWLGPGRTFCAHAPGAMEPLQSALKFFKPVFEQAAGQRKEAS